MYRSYTVFAEENEQLPPNAYAHVFHLQMASPCKSTYRVQIDGHFVVRMVYEIRTER